MEQEILSGICPRSLACSTFCFYAGATPRRPHRTYYSRSLSGIHFLEAAAYSHEMPSTISMSVSCYHLPRRGLKSESSLQSGSALL